MIRLLLFVGLLAGSSFATPLKDKPGNPITPANVAQLREVASIDRDAFRIEWMPTTGHLAVMPWESSIEILDARTFKSLDRLAAERSAVHFAFSLDGQRFAYSENAFQVTVVELKSKKSLSIEVGKSQAGIGFSPDGRHLVTGGYGTAATMWDLATGKSVRTFDSDVEGALTPVFSPDGKTIAIGNRNSDCRLFEVATGKLSHVLNKRMTHEIRFNRAGTILATTYVDGNLGTWDVTTGKPLRLEPSGGEELYTVDWSPKDDLLVTAGRNAKITLWDPKTLKPIKELDAPQWVIRARFTPDGSRLFTAGGGERRGQDRKITVWGLP